MVKPNNNNNNNNNNIIIIIIINWLNHSETSRVSEWFSWLQHCTYNKIDAMIVHFQRNSADAWIIKHY